MTVKVEEKSLQLALVKASGQLGITQENLGYKVINESNGFLGMFGKKITIEAWIKDSRNKKRDFSRPQQGKSQSPQVSRKLSPLVKEEKKALPQEDMDKLQEDLKQFCTEICRAMTGEEVVVTMFENDGRLVFDIANDFLATQANKNPKLAESFEHILRKKPRYIKQELPFRIFVDFNSTRIDRETELVDMAQDLSDKVHENKRPIVLNYRSSYDRKIIHMALDKDSRVYTKSIGSGPNRKLMILPSSKNPQDNISKSNAAI